MKHRFMVTDEVDCDGDLFRTLSVTETPDGWGYVIGKDGMVGVRISKGDLGKLRAMLDMAAREQ
jgi:hypothetical protein